MSLLTLNVLMPVKRLFCFFFFAAPFCPFFCISWGFSGGSAIKNPPAMQETQEREFQSLGQEDPLEEGMALQDSCPENFLGREV